MPIASISLRPEYPNGVVTLNAGPPQDAGETAIRLSDAEYQDFHAVEQAYRRWQQRLRDHVSAGLAQR